MKKRSVKYFTPEKFLASPNGVTVIKFKRFRIQMPKSGYYRKRWIKAFYEDGKYYRSFDFVAVDKETGKPLNDFIQDLIDSQKLIMPPPLEVPWDSGEEVNRRRDSMNGKYGYLCPDPGIIIGPHLRPENPMNYIDQNFLRNIKDAISPTKKNNDEQSTESKL